MRTQAMSNSQQQLMQLLLDSLKHALQEKDLATMERLLHEGASMARQMLEGR